MREAGESRVSDKGVQEHRVVDNEKEISKMWGKSPTKEYHFTDAFLRGRDKRWTCV